MNTAKTQSITREEMQRSLILAFESHRHCGYFYNDCGGRHNLDWSNTYDQLLSYFADDQRELIEEQIQKIMSQPGNHKIMDQGCAHATTLREVVERFSDVYPDNLFHGYGVSGSLENMWLGKVSWYREGPPEEEREISHEIHPFESKEEGNARFFGIEHDLHYVMREFPYPLDLVFSHNTYFHLVLPWLALKYTAEKLKTGGVALVGRIFADEIRDVSLEAMEYDFLLSILRENNLTYEIIAPEPVHGALAIIKREEAEFKTNLYVLVNEEGWQLTVYSPNSVSGSLCLDDL